MTDLLPQTQPMLCGSLADLDVAPCPLADIKSVIESTHYSHSVFGVTTSLCFRVSLRAPDAPVVGGAIFGRPGAYNVTAKYDDGGRHTLLELRRFVMVDGLPRNNESYVLARMLRLCRDAGVTRVLSYADPAYGHQGIIYQATGFRRLGTTSPRKHIMWRGKKYPDRNIHQTHFPFHKELRAALESGEATRVAVPGKIIYLKDLLLPRQIAKLPTK